ncbi:N6-adenosine-methyltransferase catalytic subunit [Ischnura elegans]|uniref:N6-adenosine-methyltransferase catalytic subunit n=1 Tax=Ischnura elegans TaxID=197161 RepID=UPI001ED88F9D|nr:N6-adenosine-methyltransferase catalytic subunit [Ischnura elegans]
MSDAWSAIQEIKSKRNSLREKLQKRKKERQDLFNLSAGTLEPSALPKTSAISIEGGGSGVPSPVTKTSDDDESREPDVDLRSDPEVESRLLQCLSEVSLTLPTSSWQLAAAVGKQISKHVLHIAVVNLLQKFAAQQLIGIKECTKNGQMYLEVASAEHAKLVAMVNELSAEGKTSTVVTSEESSNKRKGDGDTLDESAPKVACLEKEEKKKDKKEPKDDDIMSLLSMPSIREKESKKVGEEILDLLSKPTAKERSLAERFRSQGGAQVMEFCPHGTKGECAKVSSGSEPCKKLHFKKIIQKHTDESLGDCSFLNTCFHMDSCKYVHYEVDGPTVPFPKDSFKVGSSGAVSTSSSTTIGGSSAGEASVNSILSSSATTNTMSRTTTILCPPQWIQCDLRYLDMNVLGKFAVIMADPPWDIHMELPYGTMSDDEMRQLGIPTLQDDGLIFLWVTGRAMELGRECLKLWGYERVDEIIWVKTNQLQRIIRTGRTGHWLNHGKEHCLVGMKGNPSNLNRGLDCDVIVAEVRATSHKPDEIYGIIERLSPGTRKIELFGRPHNVQPNWITLGNQLDGVRLVDPELIKAFRKRYPDGNCMAPSKT